MMNRMKVNYYYNVKDSVGDQDENQNTTEDDLDSGGEDLDIEEEEEDDGAEDGLGNQELEEEGHYIDEEASKSKKIKEGNKEVFEDLTINTKEGEFRKQKLNNYKKRKRQRKESKKIVDAGGIQDLRSNMINTDGSGRLFAGKWKNFINNFKEMYSVEDLLQKIKRVIIFIKLSLMT